MQHKCNPVIVLIQYFLIGLLDYGKNNNQYCNHNYLTQVNYFKIIIHIKYIFSENKVSMTSAFQRLASIKKVLKVIENN